MSPLWREQVQVLLAPMELTLACFEKGLRPTRTAKTTVPIVGCGAQDMPAWTSCLPTLARVLAVDEWAKGDLAVVLSNHFVRYRVVPWLDELRDEQELTAYAEQALRQASGRSAGDWAVTVSVDCVGSPFVASAVDAQLIGELKACAAHQDRELVSVRPLLMEAFNCVKGWLTDACYWLAIVEEGLICAALVGKGRWVAVRTVRTHGDWPAELVALLEREQFLVEEAESAQTVLLHVVNGSYQELPANHWTVRPVYSAQSRHSIASVLSCEI